MNTQTKVSPYVFPLLTDTAQLNAIKKTKIAGYIVKIICRQYGVSEERMRSPQRATGVVDCRHMIVGLLNEYTTLSHTEIGYIIGDRHRATVVNCLKKFNELLESDKIFKNNHKEIMENL